MKSKVFNSFYQSSNAAGEKKRKKKRRANLFSGQLSGLTKKATSFCQKKNQEHNSLPTLQQEQGGSLLGATPFFQKDLQCSQQSMTTNSYKNQTQTIFLQYLALQFYFFYCQFPLHQYTSPGAIQSGAGLWPRQSSQYSETQGFLEILG